MYTQGIPKRGFSTTKKQRGDHYTVNYYQVIIHSQNAINFPS